MIKFIKRLLTKIFKNSDDSKSSEISYLDIYTFNDMDINIESNIENDDVYPQQVTDVIEKIDNTMNLEKLNGVIPSNVISEIPMVIEKFEINTSLRLAHFLSQCSHESGGFKLMVENLNYSAQGLANTWPNRFAVDRNQNPLVPNPLALQIQRNQQKIANIVYANRMDNGDEASGDGWKFRGRGYIQLTGKANYTAFNRFVGDNIISYPDLVASKYPLLSAGWFFHTNGIHKLADGGASRANVEAVTRRVNGGLIGIDHRISEFNKYYKLLV
jgi:putative chitinase